MKHPLLALALLTTAATGQVAERVVMIEVAAYRDGTLISHPTVVMPAEPVDDYNASVGLRDGDRARLHMDLRLAAVEADNAEVAVRYRSPSGAAKERLHATRVELPWGEAQPLTPPDDQLFAGREIEVTATRINREALNAMRPGAGANGESPCENL